MNKGFTGFAKSCTTATRRALKVGVIVFVARGSDLRVEGAHDDAPHVRRVVVGAHVVKRLIL